MVYLDTSALAKWYLNEPRSEDFAAWIQNQDDTHISTLTLVEMRCLLARRRRAGELSIALEQQAFVTLQDDIAQGFLISHSVDNHQVHGAIVLMARLSEYPLRTLDAIHLSIACELGANCLASADRVMLQTAEALGIEVVRFD